MSPCLSFSTIFHRASGLLLAVRRVPLAGIMAVVIGSLPCAWATEEPVAVPEGVPAVQPRFFVGEYCVKGAKKLPRVAIESAVYPYLGPERTEEDVKAACAALEKSYREKGYGAVSVGYDAEIGKGGVVTVRVSEGTVAKLRVKGARYFSPREVKAAAPSLSEGGAINFNDVSKDITALNQMPDRRVTPALKPGAEPGTFDVELEVKDRPPVHASVELNNRNTANTKPLRVNASVSDTNLGQTGHAAGLSYLVAPQRRADSEVFTAYYLARFAGLEKTTFMLNGTKQNSNISTLGGTTVAGPGQTLEASVSLGLPNGKNWTTGKDWADFSHSVSFSFAYKHYKQTLTTPGSSDSAGAARIVTPITYYPFRADYNATWLNLAGKNSLTELNAGINFHFRGTGSGPSQFNLNRYNADGNYIYFRGDISHTQDILWGLQVFGKLSGQLSSQPLVSSEQFSGGGLSTVRGYMEAEAVGDDGAFGTIELRSPSLFGLFKKKPSAAPDANTPANSKEAKEQAVGTQKDWRFHLFCDAGGLVLKDTLAEQQSRFSLASFGAGTRMTYAEWLSASLDAGYSLNSVGKTKAHDLRLTFRASVNY